uniref:Uncharacterized protein n=1 Tax=Setaria italica TaxID=4555 RepID=K3YNI9_SETIT
MVQRYCTLLFGAETWRVLRIRLRFCSHFQMWCMTQADVTF